MGSAGLVLWGCLRMVWWVQLASAQQHLSACCILIGPASCASKAVRRLHSKLTPNLHPLELQRPSSRRAARCGAPWALWEAPWPLPPPR